MNKKTLLALNEIENLTGITIVEEDITKGPKLSEEGVVKLLKNVTTTAGLLDNMVQDINKIANPGAESVQPIMREDSGITHNNEALFALNQKLLGMIKHGMEIEVAVRSYYGMDKETPTLEKLNEIFAPDEDKTEGEPISNGE